MVCLDVPNAVLNVRNGFQAVGHKQPVLGVVGVRKSGGPVKPAGGHGAKIRSSVTRNPVPTQKD